MFNFKNTLQINERKEKEKAVYLLSFLLPLIMMVAILVSKQVFPFGDKCILRTDFYHQYLPFHAELGDKLKNFSSLFYTYRVGLGTNFVTLFAYYLSSPWNLLLLLVPDNFVLEYITVMVTLKIALCGLTMSYYLVKRYNTDSFVVVFFAIFYAFSGYMGAYYWDIMWLDNLVLFPLLIFGFENIINGKKPYLYIITLGLSLLCNYYIGAITCIFFLVYFVFYNVLKEKKVKEIAINFLKIGFSSIIGILISCILLIPVVYAFKTTASSDTSFPNSATEYFTIIEVIARHLPFVEVENGIDYWPNLYSGIMVFALLTLYLICKKYKVREKICYIVLFLFFIASFSINMFDFVWHVCKFPNSLPCRQSFIYTFLLLVVCIKPLLKFNSIKERDILIAFAIPISFLIIVEKLIKNEKVGYYSVYAAIILLIIYLILMLCYKNKKYDKNILLYVAVIVVCFEAFINFYQTSITTIKREDYTKNTDTIKSLTSGIKNITDDFYRVERAVMKTKDDGAFMHFPSASIFSSSCYAEGSDFYKSMGMEASTNAYSTTGSTPFADSLLSISYKIYETEEKNAKSINKREIANDDGVYLYQNLDTLPFSYVLKNDFLEDYDRTSGNPATVQNNFSRTMKLGTVLDKKEVNIDKTGATFVAEDAGDYYAFVRDKGIKEVSVTYPTTTKSFKNLNRGYFIELGYLDKGTDLEFKNDTNQDDLLIEVFRFNFDTLKTVVANITSNFDYDMKYFNDSYINYTMNSKIDGTCLITLPYDEGFTILVDGQKVELKKVMDMFLGFDIKKGDHDIVVKYVPEGFYLGLVLSLLGIVLLIAVFVIDKKQLIIKIKQLKTHKTNAEVNNINS